jgi:hypothetical protein
MLKITTEHAPRTKPLRILLAVYFFSSQMYIPHICQLQLHSTTWLYLLHTSSRCGHIILYAIRSGHSADMSADSIRGLSAEI